MPAPSPSLREARSWRAGLAAGPVQLQGKPIQGGLSLASSPPWEFASPWQGLHSVPMSLASHCLDFASKLCIQHH